MKGGNLIGWLVAALVASAVAWWALGDRAPQRDVASQGPLLPELASRLNDIDSVRIVGAGGATLATLQKHDDRWGLVERNGYPVDTGKLRSLLLGLTQARRVEAKTANPALYERLAVEDVSNADAKGVAVVIEGGGAPLQVVVGENNSRGSGTYVRVDGDPSSWLVDQNIAVERRPVEWLQRDLVNLPTARIASVVVTPPSGDPIRIAREEDAAGDFRVQNLPRGREQQSEFVADATAGLLDGLRFDDVFDAEQQPEPETGVRVAEFVSSDGLEVVVRSWQADGKTFARLQAEVDEQILATLAGGASDPSASSPEAGTDAAAEAGAEPVAADAPAGDAVADDADTAKQDAATRVAALRDEFAALQQRFADRVFVLPNFKASSLNRDLEAYLKAKE